jgi:hypothetical protein
MSIVAASESFAALLGQLHEQGFCLGPPAHVKNRSLAVDRACARRLRCPSCKRKGLTFLPFHLGDSYRGLVRCRCGAGREW